MNKTDTRLSATKLRWILLGCIGVLICGGVAGAWYLQGLLNAQMVMTNTVKAEALNSGNDLAKAQALKLYLQKNQEAIKNTAAIAADTETYRYQNQIVKDITSYASKAGLTILGFDFPLVPSNSPLSTSGLKSITATITLQNPVDYTKYLTFLKMIEQNLTRMQVTDISISLDKDHLGLINNPVVGIEVYTK